MKGVGIRGKGESGRENEEMMEVGKGIDRKGEGEGLGGRRREGSEILFFWVIFLNLNLFPPHTLGGDNNSNNTTKTQSHFRHMCSKTNLRKAKIQEITWKFKKTKYHLLPRKN